MIRARWYYLAKIYLGDELINDWMIDSGFAEPYYVTNGDPE